jgi:histidine triad (HIT) family protein
MEDCLFCRIAAGEIPATVVYSDEEMVAFRDINPQAPVHILIIPRRHIGHVDDLQEGDAGLAGRLILRAKELAAAEGLSKGFRLVFNCREEGGQEVEHLHLHLLGGRAMQWPPG